MLENKLTDLPFLEGEIQRGVLDLRKEEQHKIVEAQREDVVVLPDDAMKVLSKVTVKGVTADIDENIKAENIKLGVNILGIEGNVAPDKPDQEKTIYPSEEEQVVVADLGYELSKVISKPVETESVRVEPSTSEQVVKASEGKYIKEFTVGAVEDLDGEIAEQEVILAELEAQVNDFDDKGDFDVESVVDEAKGTQVLVVNGKNDAVEPLDITQNGEYNVARYKKVNVNVADMLQARVDSNNSCDSLFYNYHGTSINFISNLDTSKVADMRNMFYNCTNLTDLDVSNLDTSKVTIMYYMFNNCRLLTTLDLSNWNTSNATNMESMFHSCESLLNLDLSSFDTNNVNNMRSMFRYCRKFQTLDLSNFNTTNVTDMGSMFEGCNALTTLDLSNFDTSKVTSMYWMFYQCFKLTSLNTSNWDTSKVTSMQRMFSNCGFTSLDISHFDMSNVTDTGNMFQGCSGLTNVILPSKIKEIDSGFFANCTKLTEFTILAETPPKLANTTSCIISATTSIYVPDASVDAYKTATNWSAYADLIKPLSSKGV